MKKEQEPSEASEYERGVEAARKEWERTAYQRGYEDEMRRLRRRHWFADLEPAYHEPLLWKCQVTCEGDK